MADLRGQQELQPQQPLELEQNDELEINFVELLYRLIERMRYIIAAAILGAVLAGLVTTLLIKPSIRRPRNCTC